MGGEPTEDDIRLSERFAAHAQRLDDFHNEMAGRDVGRIARFTTAEGRAASIAGGEKEDKRADLTTLQIIMMHNKALAEAFRETEKRLRQVQSRLDETLELVVLAKAESEERLRGLSNEDRAEEEARLDALNELESDIRTGQAEIGEMQEEMDQNGMDMEDFERFGERADRFESTITARAEELKILSPPPGNDAAAPMFSEAAPDVPKL